MKLEEPVVVKVGDKNHEPSLDELEEIHSLLDEKLDEEIIVVPYWIDIGKAEEVEVDDVVKAYKSEEILVNV